MSNPTGLTAGQTSERPAKRGKLRKMADDSKQLPRRQTATKPILKYR